MNTAHVPTLEIDSLGEWDARITTVDSIAGWVMQAVDLSERSDDLQRVDPRGASFLGCTLPADLVEELRERGALIFPPLPHVPFEPYRSSLYSAFELYDAVAAGELYAQTTDARIYSWTNSLPGPDDLAASLAMTLHDHSITDALEDLLDGIAPECTVGILGGHAMSRGSDDYVGAARLASQLTKAGFTVLTGGGPGAMEAANLGAYLAGQPAALVHAIGHLSSAPDYQDNETLWAATAMEVRAQTHPSGRSVGIPTWFYGHELPNVFASQIAKYFSNALREDILLQHCHGGLIYLPGAAGTIQEVFQAATGNYYAASPELISPMIFVGHEYWTDTLPVWPLISALASGREMADHLLLVDDVDAAADHLAGLLEAAARRQNA